MKARELMGCEHGQPGGVYADTIEEAEAYVARFPADRHGWQIAAAIRTKADMARGLLADAGYRWDDSRGAFVRDQFHATGTVRHDGVEATIFVHSSAAGKVALAAGPGGYLHPGDRPEV